MAARGACERRGCRSDLHTPATRPHTGGSIAGDEVQYSGSTSEMMSSQTHSEIIRLTGE